MKNTVWQASSHLEISLSDDEVLIIVPSGWNGRYHVIYEWPGLGDYGFKHKLMTREQLIKQYSCKYELDAFEHEHKKKGNGDGSVS